MICCCTNVFRLCKPVGTCADSTLILPYTGLTPDAEFIFRTDFLASVIEIPVTADSTGAVELPTQSLNEDYAFVGGLYDATGVKQTFAVDGITYDCIQFQTKTIINVT